MAEKLTKAQILAQAKVEVATELAPYLSEKEAIQVDEYTYAVETSIPNQYVEITLTAKNSDATAKSEAYNPIEKADAWLAEKELKAKNAADKDAEKARKKAADEAKRAAAKAAKDAAKNSK